jgi:hypothetical protein
MKEENNYHLLRILNVPKTREVFKLDIKDDLSENAWEYFWENVKGYDISAHDIAFFNMIHALKSFNSYEKEHRREYLSDGPTISFSQEVFLNMLSVPEAIELLLNSNNQEMKEKMHYFMHVDFHWFFKQNGISQQSLDLLIEEKVLNLSDPYMQEQLLYMTEGKYYEQAGLFSCFQAAMRHHAFDYSEDHITLLIKKCWDEMDVKELQKWHRLIGEPLHWTDLVLNSKNLSSASSYESLSQELKTCLSDAHAHNFNRPHENFCWLLALPANYETEFESFDNFYQIDFMDNYGKSNVPISSSNSNANANAYHDDNYNSYAWSFLEDEMPSIVHGMIKAFGNDYYKEQDNLFKNINAFVIKIKDNAPQAYEKMCHLAKTLKTEHKPSNAKFAKMFSAIVLHENLTEQLLSGKEDAEPDSQAIKMKI